MAKAHRRPGCRGVSRRQKKTGSHRVSFIDRFRSLLKQLYNSALFSPLSIPATEKEDNQLFFIQREVEEGDSTERNRRRKRKPLKSEAFLRPNPAIVGFPSCKRKRTGSKPFSRDSVGITEGHSKEEVDSSSEDEEYDKSIAFSKIKKQRESSLASLRKQQPPKPSIQTTAKDLWSDDGMNKTNICIEYKLLVYIPIGPLKTDIPDEHYLRVTRKKPVKVSE